MFVFAILYFGIMSDAGLLDPIVDRILRGVGTRPRRIVVGSALLALLVHLDGSGAVTFLVTIPAMLPLFERLQMDKRILACVASMAAGVNFLPWTGPTLARLGGAARHRPPSCSARSFRCRSSGLLFVFAVAWLLGTQGGAAARASPHTRTSRCRRRALTPEARALRRPGRFWINALLTLVVDGGDGRRAWSIPR